MLAENWWVIKSVSPPLLRLKLHNKRSFIYHLLPFVKIQELRIKEKHLFVSQNINGLSTFRAVFMALLYALMNGYSNGNE